MTEKKNDLTFHWIMMGTMLSLLVIFNIICQLWGHEIQINLPEQQRIFIRTILYAISIILFPLVSLTRHILIRLNQTMLGNNPAKNRYFLTITVTLTAMSIIGVFGFAMFYIGDGYNTLYIFSFLAALGIFLHRPKLKEYQHIIHALTKKCNVVNNHPTD